MLGRTSLAREPRTGGARLPAAWPPGPGLWHAIGALLRRRQLLALHGVRPGSHPLPRVEAPDSVPVLTFVHVVASLDELLVLFTVFVVYVGCKDSRQDDRSVEKLPVELDAGVPLLRFSADDALVHLLFFLRPFLLGWASLLGRRVPRLNPFLTSNVLVCSLLELLERKVGGRPALVVDGVLLTGSSSVSAEEVIVPRLVELRLGFGRIPGLVCVSLELLRKLALHCLLAGVPVLVQLAPCPDPHICRPLPGPARLVECRPSLQLQVHGPVVERRRVAAVVTHHPHGGLGGVTSS